MAKHWLQKAKKQSKDMPESMIAMATKEHGKLARESRMEMTRKAMKKKMKKMMK